MFLALFTYFTKILLLNFRLFSTSILSKTMQFLQEDDVLLTMFTTAWLLQKIIILVFHSSFMFSHVKMPAQRANNSKYSMLGWDGFKNILFHCPKAHLLSKKQP